MFYEINGHYLNLAHVSEILISPEDTSFESVEQARADHLCHAQREWDKKHNVEPKE